MVSGRGVDTFQKNQKINSCRVRRRVVERECEWVYDIHKHTYVGIHEHTYLHFYTRANTSLPHASTHISKKTKIKKKSCRVRRRVVGRGCECVYVTHKHTYVRIHTHPYIRIPSFLHPRQPQPPPRLHAHFKKTKNKKINKINSCRVRRRVVGRGCEWVYDTHKHTYVRIHTHTYIRIPSFLHPRQHQPPPRLHAHFKKNKNKKIKKINSCRIRRRVVGR